MVTALGWLAAILASSSVSAMVPEKGSFKWELTRKLPMPALASNGAESNTAADNVLRLNMVFKIFPRQKLSLSI